MKSLEECLTGLFKSFSGKRHLNELMQKHKGFHCGNNIWFVRNAWAAGQIVIFKVWFKAETSAQPQSDINEEGIVESFIELDVQTFASAMCFMTDDVSNYHRLLKMLVPEENNQLNNLNKANMKKDRPEVGDYVSGSWRDTVTGFTYFTQGIVTQFPAGLFVVDKNGGGTGLDLFFQFAEIKRQAEPVAENPEGFKCQYCGDPSELTPEGKEINCCMVCLPLHYRIKEVEVAEKPEDELLKPPLGLRPKWFVTEQRVMEILGAIERYEAIGKEIPEEWLEEFSELTNER